MRIYSIQLPPRMLFHILTTLLMKLKHHLRNIPLYLLIAMMIYSIFKYTSSPEVIQWAYAAMWFPEWAFTFNLTAKILWVIALAIPSVPQRVKDFAWAWFLYVFLMWFLAHFISGVGSTFLAVVALALWIIAFWIDVYKKSCAKRL